MTAFKDISGNIFGDLTAIKAAYRRARLTYWECLCICGKTTFVNIAKLNNGHTKSCGCRKYRVTHGDTRGRCQTKEYKTWCGIINRCTKPNTDRYCDYGGRGINVCERWLNSFENFLEDMGRAPSKKHSIEREDNDNGYSKINCKWATSKEQSRNRRSNKVIEFNGVIKVLQDWAIELKVTSSRIRYYLRNGKTFDWVYHYIKNKK